MKATLIVNRKSKKSDSISSRNNQLTKIKTQLDKQLPHQQITHYTYRSISEFNTDVTLKWADITFYDGRIGFSYKAKTFIINSHLAREAYNSIVSTFAKRLPPICVKIRDSVAVISNDIEFNRVISILELHQPC